MTSIPPEVRLLLGRLSVHIRGGTSYDVDVRTRGPGLIRTLVTPRSVGGRIGRQVRGVDRRLLRIKVNCRTSRFSDNKGFGKGFNSFSRRTSGTRLD